MATLLATLTLLNPAPMALDLPPRQPIPKHIMAVKAAARERAADDVREWRAEQRRLARERAERRAREAAERAAKKAAAQTADAYYGGGGAEQWRGLALEVGWPESDIPTLLRIIQAESSGNPRATNGQYRGLLQFSSYWYNDYWHFDPYDPRQALIYGLKLKRMCGWSQWSTY